MKNGFVKYVKEYFAVVLAGFITAFYMHMFILPARFVPGGISGVAAILEFVGVLDAKYGIYLFNVPLLILALVFLKKDFAIKTVVSTTVTTLAMMFFDFIDMAVFTDDKLISVFLAGILGGVAFGLAFGNGGSNGGTEIIARLIMKKNPEADPGRILFLFNVVIMGAGGFFTGEAVYDFWTVVYSLALSYVSSSVYRILSRGIDPAQKFFIITEKGEEISKAITANLKRGVSMTLVKGKTPAHSNAFAPKSMLMVVVQERQTPWLKRYVKQTDPQSFSFSVRVDDVITRPGFNKRYRWKL